MNKKREEEQPDGLGFTPSDYDDMQKLKDREGKLNDMLLSGWDVTPEQITIINSPCHPLHRVAVITFYDVNFKRIKQMAFNALSYGKVYSRLLTVINYEDLLQQVFCDLLGGFLKLPHDTTKIHKAIYRCFYFTAVGGLEGVEDVKADRTAQFVL